MYINGNTTVIKVTVVETLIRDLINSKRYAMRGYGLAIRVIFN